jgi:hypothetical protein
VDVICVHDECACICALEVVVCIITSLPTEHKNVCVDSKHHTLRQQTDKRESMFSVDGNSVI